MILGNGWLFISTMKCATHSLYEALPGVRISPELMHPTPNIRMAPMHWTVCRNPYDRAVSVWASTALRQDDKYYVRHLLRERGGDYRSFHDFVAKILMHPEKPRIPLLFSTQSVWHDTFECDGFARFENLERDVEAIIRQPVKLQKLNVSKRDGWMRYVTLDVADMLDEWADEDFRRYGYQRMREAA